MLLVGVRRLVAPSPRSIWPKTGARRCRATINKHTLSPTPQSGAFARAEKYFPLSFTLTAARWAVTLWLGTHIFVDYFYEFAPATGISMLPTIPSHGSVLWVSKYYRRGRDVKVGDTVSYEHPMKEGERAVKRVIGMPGDFVLRGTPGEGRGMLLQVPEGHCYVVGDNLTWSRDSRLFGPLPLALIRGKVLARWGPNYTEFATISNDLLDAIDDEVD